ncbi:MAG: DUF58 domain-containing protein [Candidatus Latescibacteria bacterium]|nr:DUF58 domain-containing protein [Candidatus Latescibacterota bacterium]
MDMRHYVTPEIVAKLSRFDLIARLVVEGFIAGLHRSPYHGFSVEFAEHRQYMPGDPVKDLDWKIYARSDRLYVKEYEEETNLKAYLLIDSSRSMAFGSQEVTKFLYVRCLAAALSYLMIRQRDAVGMVLFDTAIRSYIPPRSVGSHLNVLLTALQHATPGERTDLGRSFHDIAERIKRRGLIVVLSDLLDNPEDLMAGLRHLRHRHHEVIVFHVLDPRERDLHYEQPYRFKDMEGDLSITTDPSYLRSRYRAAMDELSDTYRRACREAMIDYVPLDTAVPFDTALFRYLSTRKRLG